MKTFGFLVFFAVTLFVSESVIARTFSFSNEKYAAYFRGTVGSSAIQKTAFENSGGEGAIVDDQANYNFSGEFGLAITFSKASIRIGVEGLAPSSLQDVPAKNAAGDELYTMRSESAILNPKLSFDIHLRQWTTSRLYMTMGASYPKISMQNAYTLTEDGNAAYPGVANYFEEGIEQTTAYEGGFGFETLMTDTTTFTIEAGYRRMIFENMKHNRNITNFAGEVISKKDPVLNTDGTARTLDFSGPYVGIAFRFYIKMP